MRVRGTAELALAALASSKARTALTMLDVIIGVAAVVTMMAVGGGARARVEAQIQSLGSNVIVVISGSITTGGVRLGTGSQLTLTEDDAKAMEREIESMQIAAPAVRGGVQVIAGNANWSTALFGVTPGFLDTRDWAVARGRPLAPDDVDAAAKVAILGLTVEAAARVLSLLLASIASVSLVVGGIMNIMLVSVTERTREIGLRRAVGARRRDLLGQFLIEAVAVSLTGGLIGIVVGAVASWAIARFAGWPAPIRAATVVPAFLFAGMVGIFFGFYPARKASLLNPIDALRHE